MRPPEDFADLARLSARLGADPLVIQGAGGNTSVKDGAVMWIKASGTQLADAPRQRSRGQGQGQQMMCLAIHTAPGRRLCGGNRSSRVAGVD